MRREVLNDAERARWDMEVRHMVWYCRPWYQRLILTLLLKAP